MKKTLLLLLIPFFVSSCLDDKPRVKNYYEEEVNYVFSRFIEKDDKLIYRMKLNHPLRITQKQMDKIMLSLKYQPDESLFDVFSAKTDDVFNPETILSVAPQFRKKFSKLQPEEKLVFAIIDQQARTSGEVFVVGNGMHWRFDYIKGESYIQDQKKIIDWIAPWTDEEENFQLLPQKGQLYHLTHTEKPRAGNRNWIIVPVRNEKLTKKDDVMLDYVLRQSMQDDKEGTRRIIRNKLMMLQKEYEGGVLSYEEYIKRREDILDAI